MYGKAHGGAGRIREARESGLAGGNDIGRLNRTGSCAGKNISYIEQFTQTNNKRNKGRKRP